MSLRMTRSDYATACSRKRKRHYWDFLFFGETLSVRLVETAGVHTPVGEVTKTVPKQSEAIDKAHSRGYTERSGGGLLPPKHRVLAKKKRHYWNFGFIGETLTVCLAETANVHTPVGEGLAPPALRKI